MVTDPAPLLFAVDPIRWLVSFGRQPLKRSLEPVRDIIALRDLRKHHGDAAEIARLDRTIRTTFFPVFQSIFNNVGLTPANCPEEVARDAVILDLLDKLCTAGFLRMADVRDALARFQLKLPDTSRNDLIRGDALLRADRQLAEALYGVYHRGEIYLRGIQRFSGLVFGTGLGRWLTLFVALPFGGAFLTVEFVKHMSHAAGKLIGKLNSSDSAPPAESPPHGSGFDGDTLTAIGALGLIYLLMIHVPRVQTTALLVLKQIGKGLRFILLTMPGLLIRSAPVQFVLNNAISRFILYELSWPIAFTLPFTLLFILLGHGTANILKRSVAVFIIGSWLCNTNLGLRLRAAIAEWFRYAWRYLSVDVLAGLVAWVLWFFRRTLGVIERLLHTVDEWLRLRPDQPVWVKAVLALLWFPLAYVIRFGFYLLLEPQVNPIKHFPVVTVSHKVMFGLIGTVADLLHISLETAGLILTLVPGIFGFLVWEFKENWKLYAANRSLHLKPLPIGHHGETIRGLLRPGFHSGTLPKLFEKIRKEEAKPEPDPKRLAKWNRELDHVAHEVADFVERQGAAYWQQVPEFETLTVTDVHVSIARIAVTLSHEQASAKLIWEYVNESIVGRIENAAWLDRFPGEAKSKLQMSLNGVLAMGSVDRVIAWNDWLRFWKTA